MMKRIKESIQEKDQKKLIAQVLGAEMREYKRQNLLGTFVLLYYTGLRLNEIQTLRIQDLLDLLENGEMKIKTQKTNTERKLYLSKNFKRDILKYINLEQDPENKIIQKHNYKRSSIHEKAYINLVNSFMKDVLGTGYTSHSFRQGILTEMGSKGINPKIMKEFIGHKNINTTLGYIKPTDEDIKNALVR